MRTIILFLLVVAGALAQNYTCTSAGRFPYSDTTCRSYYLCVLYNGAYVQSNYTCPSTMTFNPTTQTCVTNSTCITTICDNCPLVPPLPKLPDPNGQDCTTYIQCVGLTDRYPVVVTCPSGLYFDKYLQDCWFEGNCSPEEC